MNFLLLLLSIISAFIFDALWWGYIVRGYVPPLVVIVAFFWMIRLPLNHRIVLALTLGILLDTINFLPAGTYSLLLLGAAFFCQLMKRFFDNTESRLVGVIHITILIIVFRIVASPTATLVLLLSNLHG